MAARLALLAILICAGLGLLPGTGAAASRGIELVNSPDKGNQNVYPFQAQGFPLISPDGDRVVWGVAGAAPGGVSGSFNTFVAERTSHGWTSKSVLPPLAEQVGDTTSGHYALDAVTPDLSHFIFTAPEGGGLGTAGRILVRIDLDQNQEVLQRYPETVFSGGIDLTDDGGTVLLPGQGTPRHLEDVGRPGAPEVVSVMPDGQPNECPLEFGDGLVGIQRLAGNHVLDVASGARLYFQARENGSSCTSTSTPSALYERDREDEETLLVDPGVPNHSPEFIRASPNGRLAYFATWSELDPSDLNSDADIYRWDDGTRTSRCLTCVVSDAKLKEWNTGLAYLRVSDDLSHAYFESTRELVPGRGHAGDDNLYVLSGGEIRFVADLASPAGFEPGVLGEFTSRLSQDGHALVFESRPLTADPIAPECKSPEGSLGACTELYRYDDRDGSLKCISCNKEGATTHSIGAWGLNSSGEFQVSADGETVAFTTAEPLVPSDTNGTADVYEWRDGDARLVSDGVTPFNEAGSAAPTVYGVSADGRDIFFSLVDPGLTGFEQDGLANLYDARIGGGFDLPPPTPPSCDEEACQGPIPPPPAFEAPGTSTFRRRGGGARHHHRHRRCKVRHAHRTGRCSRVEARDRR